MDVPQVLIHAIETGFAAVKLGGGLTLGEADALDGYGDPDTLREARQAEPPGPWQALSAEHLERGSRVLMFLDGEGFRYYLPALMCLALRQPDYADIPSLLIAELVHPPEVDERFEVLSSAQRTVVSRFLRYFAGEEAEQYSCTPEAQRALDLGWSRYLAG